jgi:hypothetical protein
MGLAGAAEEEVETSIQSDSSGLQRCVQRRVLSLNRGAKSS